MNKTGARLLGAFAASLIAWAWKGWGERATGVPMADGFIASLGSAMVVLVEWMLVRPARRPAKPASKKSKKGGPRP